MPDVIRQLEQLRNLSTPAVIDPASDMLQQSIDAGVEQVFLQQDRHFSLSPENPVSPDPQQDSLHRMEPG